jgi:hypothetical protein
MGQGLSTGAVTGFVAQMCMTAYTTDIVAHGAVWGGMTLAGVGVDFVSDACAKTGKVQIERQVLLNATDSLKNVTSFYARNDANFFTRFVGQKHEWCVLESHTKKYYIVQKEPQTGDVSIQLCKSMRQACDFGLRAANRPIMDGETQLHRTDCTFDLPEDLQVAYVIAWMKKEDPRWAFSTENSRHFCLRLRLALNDF